MFSPYHPLPMPRRRRTPLLLSLLSCALLWIATSGMICDRVADLPVRVRKDVLFQLRPDDALAEAGIRDQGGKIPEGLPQKTFLFNIDGIVDLSAESEFQKYQDRIRRVHINRVWLTVRLNTSPVSVDAGQLGISPLPASGGTGEAPVFQPIATTPRINAKQGDIRVPLVWEEGGINKTLDLLKAYRFILRLTSPFTVEAGMPYPVGELQIQLEVEVTFVIGVL